MYELLRSITLQSLFQVQLPIVFVSIVIAELFYKFGSFTLEVVAFLVTWYVLDLGAQFARRRLRPARQPAGSQEDRARGQ
jgi:hypothetical protein